MSRTIRTTFVLCLAIACTGPALAIADPSIDQVYETLNAGHTAQAQQMMTQVLSDHPQSATAHFVAAEVYARAGDLPTARQELATAERLSPGLPRVKAESVQALQRELTQAQPLRVQRSDAPRPVFPLRGVLLVVGGLLVLWVIFRRRPAPVAGYPSYPGAVPAGAGPGPYYGGPGAGVGSGIAGGLASGLAVGAGVVAGEELARHFLDRPGSSALPETVAPTPDNADLGGNDFGVSDTSSWDDGGGSAGGDFGGGGGDWS
jgi:hypothetical protein